VDERKKSPLDFALWKNSKPGEPFWESPWGKGRPGWHIECSAMSRKYLGDPFDIHGGGMDLIFPHHENEIAQSECTTGKEFARYWLHNGFVNIDKEKMSKSLKNFLTIREVLKTSHPEAIRLFFLSNHYRSPVDFSTQNLIEAKAGLDRFYALLSDLENTDSFSQSRPEIDEAEIKAREETAAFPKKFKEAMDDDFNTAAAIGHLYTLTRTLNSLMDRKKKDPSFNLTSDLAVQARKVFKQAGGVFGILQEPPRAYFENQKKTRLDSPGITEEEIKKLIARRSQARKDKDWQKADFVRDALAEKGIVLKDTPQGTQWSFKDN
jgi:cysteinyl-tRNA synthetase